MDQTTAANAPDVRAASIGTERVAGDYPLPELGDRAFVADGPIFLDAVLGTPGTARPR